VSATKLQLPKIKVPVLSDEEIAQINWFFECYFDRLYPIDTLKYFSPNSSFFEKKLIFEFRCGKDSVFEWIREEDLSFGQLMQSLAIDLTELGWLVCSLVVYGLLFASFSSQSLVSPHMTG
jgi:hypothetical protein